MTHPALMAFTNADQGGLLPHTSEDKGVELLYAPSEAIFSAVASEMVALGWSLYPQSSEGRYPGRVFQDPIKWAEEHDLKNKLPSKAALGLWKAHCGTLNVAVVFGPASSHTFAIDIDCTEPYLAAHLVALADEILGYSPLRREGRAPKTALIYRHAAADPVASRALTLAVDSDEKQMLEIQGAGKSLTFHGKHHRTGRYFKWCDDSPIMVGPNSAPLVTADQVARYVDAVENAHGFVKTPTVLSTGTYVGAAINMDGFRIPTMTETGVAQGRWHLTNAIVFATVRANADLVRAAIAGGPEAVAQCNASLAQAATLAWHETAVLGGRWTEAFLAKIIATNMRTTVDGVRSGRVTFRPPRSQPVRAPIIRSPFAALANINHQRRKKPTTMPQGTAPCHKQP